jgi:hypothetical protein
VGGEAEVLVEVSLWAGAHVSVGSLEKLE